jgi:hypothetical protein
MAVASTQRRPPASAVANARVAADNDRIIKIVRPANYKDDPP